MMKLERTTSSLKLPPEQQAISEKCFHPSGTYVEFSREDVESCIPARFENIVRMYPHQIAMDAHGERITYEALNRHANRLANAIVRRRGISQEPIVIYIEHEISTIVAFLASLKAGKYALRVDPAVPTKRARYLLENCRAPLILTDSLNTSIVHPLAPPGSEIFNINDLDEAANVENLEIPLSSLHYAYINFTSGSTGQAKGALKSHRFLLHNVSNFANLCHTCASDRIAVLGRNALGIHSFNALLVGAAQCLVPKGIMPMRVIDWLTEAEISVLISIPTAFRNLLATVPGLIDSPALRLIRLGGEPLFTKDFELYRSRISSRCILVNSYSSQETGTVSFYLCDQNSKLSTSHVPVGYPVTDTSVLILDEFGSPTEPNGVGEIVVKSSFLSSGYLENGGSKTPVPVAAGGHQFSVYHTGDVGQLSVDGCLTHLGRNDSRIKVRGFRVNIGEVEATITAHPEIRQATVVANEDGFGDARVVAYFVAKSDSPPATSTLRQFLAKTLPDYMIPSCFVALNELPLTAAGKVDRRALPDPGKSRPPLDIVFVAPRNEVEQRVAEIWERVLGIEAIGMNDNFFDLGGHSLSASRVITRVVQTFQLELSIKDLFASPNVAAMAKVIAKSQMMKADAKMLERMLSEVEAMNEDDVRTQLRGKESDNGE